MDEQICDYSFRPTNTDVVKLIMIEMRSPPDKDHGSDPSKKKLNALKRKTEELKHDYNVSKRYSIKDEYDMGEIHIVVDLKRKFLRSFIENIAPTGLLVMVSWVSCSI